MLKQISSEKLTCLGFCIFVVCFAVVSISFAWQTPGNTPPNNDASTPLNVGSTSQYKSGNLGVGTNPGGTFPSTALDVNGTIRVRGGTPTAGSTLLSTDTTGLASWGTCTAGTAGPKGPQGPTGTTGTTGVTGPTGPAGIRGTTSLILCTDASSGKKYSYGAYCETSCTLVSSWYNVVAQICNSDGTWTTWTISEQSCSFAPC